MNLKEQLSKGVPEYKIKQRDGLDNKGHRVLCWKFWTRGTLVCRNGGSNRHLAEKEAFKYFKMLAKKDSKLMNLAMKHRVDIYE